MVSTLEQVFQIFPKSYDKPTPWQQKDVSKIESPLITVDVRTKKPKSSNDDSVTQNKDQSLSVLYGTLDTTAHFTSEVDYTVNHNYEIMATAELNTSLQLCDLERNQTFTILLLVQNNPY